MIDLLMLVLFGWLSIKVIGLTFRVTWGLAKFAAMFLFILAFPSLIGCLLLAGGLILLIPIALVASAFGILNACV